MSPYFCAARLTAGRVLCRGFFLYTALKEGARVERPQGLRPCVTVHFAAGFTVGRVLCRDFFLYTALKEGARVERPQGLREEEPQWAHSPKAFQRWAGGATGLPFVDACMRELATTGYMSNRGRQNVSSFLCKVRLHCSKESQTCLPAYAVRPGCLRFLLAIRNPTKRILPDQP